MGNYANKIKHLYPTAIENEDFHLQDDSDGKGVKIKNWNTAKLGAMPALVDLDANVDDATINDIVVDNEANELLGGKSIQPFFATLFDMENRLRMLEGKAVVSMSDYKITLKGLYKNL